MLSAQTEFLISLFLLLACATIAGEIALRLGQLALVGQLLAGVLLGPTLLGPYLGLTAVSPELSAVQILATFFLLFMAGLEMGPGQIYSMGWKTLVLGLAIFFVPFVSLWLVVHAIAPGLDVLIQGFIAVTLAITALPVMAVMVKELGLAEREFGRVVMGAALVNELSAVTVFAVLLQVAHSGSQPSWIGLATALDATGLFLLVVFTAYFLLRFLHSRPAVVAGTSRVFQRVRSQEAGFALLMVLSLGAALLSQTLGLTFVIGAFYAGILITPENAGPKLYESLRKVLHVLMWGLFIPLFFAITGIQTNLQLLGVSSALGIFAALLVVALASKVGTGALLARFQGWSMPDSVALGFLVNSRGAVEIAMAVVLYTDGILTTFWFTIAVSVGLVCTILAPIAAVAAWKSTPKSRADLFARAPYLSAGGAMFAPADASLDLNAPHD